jgi:GNAT superfamily N-acetyltransferase
MRLLELFQQPLSEIQLVSDLSDEWDDQVGDFSPEKMGVPGKEDPRQPLLFPDLPRRVKPGATPFGDKTPMVRVGELPGLGFSVARPRDRNDDESDEQVPVIEDAVTAFYVVFDDITPVGYLTGTFGSVSADIDGNGGISLQVSSVRIDRAYAGKGIALVLYAWLMNNVCDWLEADEMQTDEGASLWKRMVLSPQFEVVYVSPVPHDEDNVQLVNTVEELAVAYDYDGGRLLARPARR